MGKWFVGEIWYDYLDDGQPNDYFAIYASNESDATKRAQKWITGGDVSILPKSYRSFKELSRSHKTKLLFAIDRNGLYHGRNNLKDINEALTFGKLKVGDEFRLPDDPDDVVLVKRSPSKYMIKGQGWDFQMKKDQEVIKESYKVHYPSLKKMTQLQYTDPRVNSEGKKIHVEKEGCFKKGDEVIEGHYVVYEDEGMPGSYIGVHIGSSISEETGEAPVNVVAIDPSRTAVMNRVSYRSRTSNSKVEESDEPLSESQRMLKNAGIVTEVKSQDWNGPIIRSDEKGRVFSVSQGGKSAFAIIENKARTKLAFFVGSGGGWSSTPEKVWDHTNVSKALKDLRKEGYKVTFHGDSEPWNEPGRSRTRNNPHGYEGDIR